jgi:polysaccharide export outer membrane protein
MNRRSFWMAAFFLWGMVTISTNSVAQAPPKGKPTGIAKDLADYIQEGRKMGMNEDDLRANAIRAGWKANIVEDAMKALPPVTKENDNPDRPDRGVPEEYIIGEADVLGVIVYKEPDASASPVVVRADGKITVPFIKDVVVSGLTPVQAEKMIATKLTPFINEPDVSVIVREVHSKRIYLVGALRKNGPVDLKYPMTVLQAITEAGGPSDFAKRKKMYVRRQENGQTFTFPFDYDAVLSGQKIEQNIWLKPGDYVVALQ